MGLLTNILAFAADVVEAEAHALRRGAMNLVVGVCLAGGFLALLLLGLGLMIWALYVLLEGPVGPAGAGFILGGISLVLSLVMIVLAKRITR